MLKICYPKTFDRSQNGYQSIVYNAWMSLHLSKDEKGAYRIYINHLSIKDFPLTFFMLLLMDLLDIALRNLPHELLPDETRDQNSNPISRMSRERNKM